jgi:hypothetical protein
MTCPRRDLFLCPGESEDNFASMPAIARVQQITHRRLSNPQYPWRVNDLSDMHFLASAAGYADFLLGEKATSHDLRCAEPQMPPGLESVARPASWPISSRSSDRRESLGQQMGPPWTGHALGSDRACLSVESRFSNEPSRP